MREMRTRQVEGIRARGFRGASAGGLLLATVLLAGCGGSELTAPPPSEAGLTWIVMPPQEASNAALLENVQVVDDGGCLALAPAEGSDSDERAAGLIHPVFASDDARPEGLAVGDLVSFGGSGRDLEDLGETDILIPPECDAATQVWFVAPQP